MPSPRPYRPGDEAGIRALFATCHGRELSAETWRWRYAGAPVLEVAEDAGRIVAHVGALPVALERGGESMKAGLWVDLMVHPDYRNLQLFLDMAESNRARCAAAGMKALFAFPNDRSYPVMKRMLDWNALEEIDALEGAIDSLKSPPSAAKIEDAASFGAEHDALWTRLRPADAWASARGAARLNWRFRERPGAGYLAWNARGADGRLLGWAAAKVFDGPQGRVGDVLDLWAEPGADDALWSAALARFRAEKIAIVSLWALRADPLHARARAWGLTPSGPRTHFAGRWTDSKTAEPFPDAARWRVAKGDSDVF